VSPQRSSDSVKTIFAFVNVPSSWAICWIVSVKSCLITPASPPGTVENAATRVISDMAMYLLPQVDWLINPLFSEF
jgi:hypothetical protein